jgi:peptidoglycan lytic transglycosylase G
MNTEAPGPGDPLFDPDDPGAEERRRRWRERQERRRARREGRPPAVPREARGRAAVGGAIEGLRRRWSARPRHSARPPRKPGASLLSGAIVNWRRIAALLGGIVVVWFLISLFQPFHGEGSGKVVVTIPKGAGVGEIGDILDDRGIVSSSTLFQIRVTLAGERSDLYSGNFTLAEGMSYSDAIDALTTAPAQRTITVTIPEGLSRNEISPLARQAGIGGDYLKASVRSPDLRPNRFGAQGRARNLEGFLFPATYELKAGASARDLAAQQLAAFKQRIGGMDMGYARKKNLTIYDVLIIASMIEREVAVPKERPLVAAVIYNRLRDGMPLGIDATTRFALNQWTKPLTVSELENPSPYNTRINAGLPPGPIGNPGIASIRAAAHPASVDYLFYVVKPGTCGEHAFSSTEAEFSRDVGRYNSAREAAGGNSPTEC